jgi:hypothetical protein
MFLLTTHYFIGYWLLAFGFWLLAFGFWLLAFGFWLVSFTLVDRKAFCPLLSALCHFPFSYYSSLITHYFIGYWLLAFGWYRLLLLIVKLFALCSMPFAFNLQPKQSIYHLRQN